ncbi:MAG TPA: cobyric acid synthase, partial [Thermodesulfatator sp.]|nr:cobyric acid synthase [Thermodesulfatator sp.]
MGEAKALMLQGTGSGVGKSLLSAGLCRLLARRGYRVAPFKAQNMALNSAVTPEGLEIGRAQAYQAEAAGILPEARMNPILLKPTADSASQVIIMGQARGNLKAKDYYRRFEEHWRVVRQAYDSLSQDYEVIVIEGAGSPAEINLQAREIVNMRMAAYAKARVYIVGDIDRGGVFAWLKGTYDLIPQEYRDLIKGFIINKFRGDIALLRPALEMFAQIVPVPIIGVVPYLHNLLVDEED